MAGGREEEEKRDAGAVERRSCIPCCAPGTLLTAEGQTYCCEKMQLVTTQFCHGKFGVRAEQEAVGRDGPVPVPE